MKIRLIALLFALSQSAAAQPAPAYREVFRIDGATEDITGSGLTIQVLRGNNVAFFDNGTAQLIYFDRTGKRLRERIPTTVGPFREMTLGPDGSVWLRKRGPIDAPDEYVVIDAAGTQLPLFRMSVVRLVPAR